MNKTTMDEEAVEALKPCPFCGWNDTAREGICHALHSDENPSEVVGPSGVCCPNCAAYVCGGMDDAEAVAAWNRRALVPDKGEVGVKALEWKPFNSYHRGAGVFGYYELRPVSSTSDADRWYVERPEDVGPIDYKHRTLIEAKAAAQADFERIIRSALCLKPHADLVRDLSVAMGLIASAAFDFGLVEPDRKKPLDGTVDVIWRAIGALGGDTTHRPLLPHPEPTQEGQKSARATEPLYLKPLLPERGSEERPTIIRTSDAEGVLFALGERFHGWLMRRHPDGQWISVRKLETADPDDNPLAKMLLGASYE